MASDEPRWQASIIDAALSIVDNSDSLDVSSLAIVSASTLYLFNAGAFFGD